MNSSEIKKKVRQFRREFGVRNPDADFLASVFEKQGFTVIEFNPLLNDPDINTLVISLGLSDLITGTNGFLYQDRNYRLVFLNEKLSPDEKRMVLAHEEGHYYCGHIEHISCREKTVQEEYEANEFVHYLLQKSFPDVLKTWFFAYRRIAIAGGIALVLAGGSAAGVAEYREHQLYEGEYYVTMHGEKYHLKNCVTIQGHETRRFTKKDADSGKYDPCSVCMPE